MVLPRMAGIPFEWQEMETQNSKLYSCKWLTYSNIIKNREKFSKITWSVQTQGWERKEAKKKWYKLPKYHLILSGGLRQTPKDNWNIHKKRCMLTITTTIIIIHIPNNNKKFVSTHSKLCGNQHN